VIGDGAVAGLLGETGTAVDLGETVGCAVCAAEAVMVAGLVGVALAVAPAVGSADGFADGVPATVIAGRGSALAGAPELRAAKPTMQVPTPIVPDTAQAMADFDNGMVCSFGLLRR
jgi:hypothetical protein